MNIYEGDKFKILDNIEKMGIKKDEKKIGLYPFQSFPLFWITLYISYKCTRKCPSCYTFKQKELEKQEMSDEMFNDLLDFVVKVYYESDISYFLVTFLGGEPLLRTDRIKKFFDRVNKDTPGMGGSIFTNGDLIDKINWDDVKDINLWNLNITNLSIEEAKRRLLIIIKNLNKQNLEYSFSNRSCVEATKKTPTMVVTFDDFNIQGNRIEKLIEWCLDNKIRLRLYRDLFKANDEEYKELLLKKYHSILDIVENYQSKGYKIFTTFLMDALIPHDWGYVDEFFTPYTCGKRILSIRADGSIGPCLRNHNYSVGNIYSENPTELIKCSDFRYTYKRDGIPEECSICDVNSICQGGCPNDKLLNYENFNTKSPWCKIHKEIIPRLLDLYRNNKK